MTRTRGSVSTGRGEPSRAARPLRILVADDERDTVLTLTMLLRDEGYEVRGVSSGRQALAVLDDFDADAVLLDIALPQLSGWEVARIIRLRPLPSEAVRAASAAGIARAVEVAQQRALSASRTAKPGAQAAGRRGQGRA